MLNMWGSRTGTNCDGSTRRDFLKVGALGMGGLLLPDLLRARAAASAAGQQTRNTSVVWLWLGGFLGVGPSWLGSAYAPFDTAGNARSNMNLQVTLDRLHARRSLRQAFDTVSRDIDRSGLMNGLDSFETQAFDLLLSRAREVL